MENNQAPENNQQCSVLLGIPAPEAAPGIVRPNSSQNRSDKREQESEAGNPIDGSGHEAMEGLLILDHAGEGQVDVNQREEASDKPSAITDGDRDHVGCQPVV